MVEKALRAKCKLGVSPQEDKIFDYTAWVILTFRRSCLLFGLFPRLSISLWPWHLSHPWEEPPLGPRMGGSVPLSDFPWAAAKATCPLLTSRLYLVWTGSFWISVCCHLGPGVSDFSPLQDHLSQWVGYSSPKSPGGKFWGLKGNVVEKGIEVSLQILILKWGDGDEFFPREGSVEAMRLERRRKNFYWVFTISSAFGQKLTPVISFHSYNIRAWCIICL